MSPFTGKLKRKFWYVLEEVSFIDVLVNLFLEEVLLWVITNCNKQQRIQSRQNKAENVRTCSFWMYVTGEKLETLG